MSDNPGGYRDELAAAQARIAELETKLAEAQRARSTKAATESTAARASSSGKETGGRRRPAPRSQPRGDATAMIGPAALVAGLVSALAGRNAAVVFLPVFFVLALGILVVRNARRKRPARGRRRASNISDRLHESRVVDEPAPLESEQTGQQDEPVERAARRP